MFSVPVSHTHISTHCCSDCGTFSRNCLPLKLVSAASPNLLGPRLALGRVLGADWLPTEPGTAGGRDKVPYALLHVTALKRHRDTLFVVRSTFSQIPWPAGPHENYSLNPISLKSGPYHHYSFCINSNTAPKSFHISAALVIAPAWPPESGSSILTPPKMICRPVGHYLSQAERWVLGCYSQTASEPETHINIRSTFKPVLCQLIALKA